MSSDIYIPMDYVLSHPTQFEITAVLNGDMEDVRESYFGNGLYEEVNQEWAMQLLEPVLQCKFRGSGVVSVVDVVTTNNQDRETDEDDHTVVHCYQTYELHFSLGGWRRQQIRLWLSENNIPFEVLE